MNINEVISKIRALIYNDRTKEAVPRSTEVVVRCLDEEFPIDCIQVEKFAGNDNEPARTVLAIRIEPPE